MRTFELLFAVVALSATYGVANSKCPGHLSKDDNLIEYGSHCYYFHDVRVGYEAAKSACVAEQGVLVMPKDSITQHLLAGFMLGRSIYYRATWIGMDDLATEGTFKWIDGTTPQPPTFWSSNPFGPSDTEDCVAIDPMDDYLWHDFPCNDPDHKWSYFCQFDTV